MQVAWFTFNITLNLKHFPSTHLAQSGALYGGTDSRPSRTENK